MHTKDDIYAYALSKSLTKVSSPATVGLYSSCHDRINMILRQIEVYMNREAVKIEQHHSGPSKPRLVKPSLAGFLSLVGRLLFYKPIWTEENQQHQNIRFIFVHFSAWHFAGSDLLWAGLVIRLCEVLQVNFGKLQLVLYRLTQHNEEEEIKKKVIEDGPNQWKSKKVCCCPLWMLPLFFLAALVAIVMFMLISDVNKPEVKTSMGINGTTARVGVAGGLAIAALGVPAMTMARFAFLLSKHLIFSQDRNIKKGMDDDRVSGQLGFMNAVRKEMWLLSRFIQFMEVFEGRRIRVIMKVTNLDRCSPKKIVAVLDAMNILLSDDESPFISILAVNPDILVEKVNFADGCFCKEDRGYALLNRIVTLAFTIPALCSESKCNLFNSLTYSSKFKEDTVVRCKRRPGRSKNTSPSFDESSMENACMRDTPLIEKTTQLKEEELENLVKSVLTAPGGKQNDYLLDDAMSMRRVINSIRVTVIIMKALKKELPLTDRIAAWVVLANRWPCRLSWIIQCAEDEEQREEIDGMQASTDDNSKTLWEIFSMSRAELYVMSSQIEDLLEQDGDPEMFEKFLKVDFSFTVKDMKVFKEATVNLDHSIRKELAQIRGTSRLRDFGWMRNLAPLPMSTIINMTAEDVCEELARMNYPGKYGEIVRNNDLSGLALVFGDVNDLKSLLQMTFGEWTTFRLHFLGLSPHLRTQNKTVQLMPYHLHNQQSRFPHHAPYHHSSSGTHIS
ncbi:NTPase KAP family P-loop domain-containing protein 1 isoform X2 [Thalassophryne amazonica]|uniref:NTPase KAP family P-loop domain-containing protein 1 isoform X2 n=1 Tax=Thalassophryne amazonica TaxID=390379 RepID=UPI0014718D09|nr:NTPase KAP family P-loop domain-containing protein 1 isoform X2 [Thalassophryne amazonica]